MSRFTTWPGQKRRPEEQFESPSATKRARREPIGLIELTSDGEEKSIDVVAVHGLQGDPFTTWESKDGGTWLEDILPKEVPSARIMTFGYDSIVAFSTTVSTIDDKARALLNYLSQKRLGLPAESSRPIVLIGHSLGGILIKKALVLANDRHMSIPRFKDIRDNTKAIAFLGVPHRGSDAAWWATFAANAVKVGTAGVSTNTTLVADLRKNSPTLKDISKQFVDRAMELTIYSFYENKTIFGVLVVDEDSARLGLHNEELFEVDADHKTICKIPSSESRGYDQVIVWIADLVRNVIKDTSTADVRLTEEQQPIHWLVPNRRIDYFVGREDILRRIDEAFTAPSLCRIVVLQAMGGQGKSQIALEYCRRKRNTTFPAIFWVDAATESAVTGSFLSIFEEIKSSTDALSDVKARVNFVLHKIASWHFKWLLVFDNYDDPRSFPNIKSYFPDSQQGAILITSRYADTNELVRVRPTNFIEVPGLEEDTALELLINRSEHDSSDIENAKCIVQRLGYHPLAITQAATYIRRRSLGFSDFMSHYKRRKEYILDKTPLISEYTKKLPGADTETALSVFTTCDLGLQQLRSESHDDIEVELLTLLAFFDNNDISAGLFTGYCEYQALISPMAPWLDRFVTEGNSWDRDLFAESLQLLRDLSMIQTCRPESDGHFHLSLHPLIKDWIRFRASRPSCTKNAMIATLLICGFIYSGPQHEVFRLAVDARKILLSNVQALQQNHEEYLASRSTGIVNTKALNIYIKAYGCCAMLLCLFGQIRDALSVLEQLRDWAQDTFGLEHPSTLSVLDVLAAVYPAAGREDQQVPLQRELVERRRRLLGVTCPDTLKSMMQLAKGYCDRKEPEEAEILLAEVLATGKEVLAPSDDTIMKARTLLAHLHIWRGRFQDGEELLTLALEVGKIWLRPGSSPTTSAIKQLAFLFAKQERWDDLKALELKWFTGIEASVVHPENQALDRLASIYLLQSRAQDATRILSRLLEERSKLLGRESYRTLQVSSRLACLLYLQGFVDRAYELMHEDISGYTKRLGADHQWTMKLKLLLEEWKNPSIRASDYNIRLFHFCLVAF